MSCLLVAGYLMPPRNFCTLTKSASLIACSFLVRPILDPTRFPRTGAANPRARCGDPGGAGGGRVGVVQVSRPGGVAQVTAGSQAGQMNGTRTGTAIKGRAN